MNKIASCSNIFALTNRRSERTASFPQHLTDQVVRGLTNVELCAVGGGIRNKIVNPPPPPPVQ